MNETAGTQVIFYQMKRQLSSKLTFLTKIILPAVCITMWTVITLTMFLGFGESRQPLPKFLFLGFSIGGTAILYFTVMKYKAVSIDDDFLYVSNYLKEISIPLSNIRDVTEIRRVRGHPVTIHLQIPSEFGSKITFTPKAKGFRFFSANPLVEELKELARLKGAKI